MWCHRKGYRRAPAACKLADSVSLSCATMTMRRSRSRAWIKAIRAPEGRCQNTLARGIPAFQLPLPVSGGICSSMKLLVLQQRPLSGTILLEFISNFVRERQNSAPEQWTGVRRVGPPNINVGVFSHKIYCQEKICEWVTSAGAGQAPFPPPVFCAGG